MGLPIIFYQVGFGVAFLTTLLVLWTLCKIIHILPGLGSLSQRHSYSIAISSTCFNYLLIKACPWIKLRGLPELEEAWKEMAQAEAAPFVIANHNSKLDSLLITALLPTWLGPRMRSLIKLALFNEPLFGGICTAVGHFPVYFKGSKAGIFSLLPMDARPIVPLESLSFTNPFTFRFLLLYTGDFGVDKEAQAKVAAAMDKFLKENGGLLM